jgi:hypothetical protein
MSEIDEILGTNENKTNNYKTNRNYTNNNRNYKQNNKNNWVEQQNIKRQEIYDTMDRMALIVGNDSEKFKEYLSLQSNFTKYSVGNCLVLLEKAPYSTQIKDENSWKEKGIELIDNAKSVEILEPTKSNGRTYYNPKVVYDISQTTAPRQNTDFEYEDRKLLEALLYNCQVPRKAVEKLPDETFGSEYNKEENLLYVCKGMDRELLFQTLSQEISNIEMKDEENSNIKSFRSYCTSYMICKKYGIDVSNFNFNNLPGEITNQKDGKGIREELDKIRVNFENINSRMSEYFENTNKEKKKSVPER